MRTVVLSMWTMLAASGVSLVAARAALAVTVRDIFREPRIEGTQPRSVQMSPDEKWVAYAWNPEGYRDPLNLYVVPTRGGDPRALTRFARSDAADSLRGEWSRLREAFGGGTSDSLRKLPRYFERDPKRVRVGAIAWSPDSRRIAFVARGDVFVVRVNGDDLTRLTHTHDAETEPQWSPDGRFLAFLRGHSVWLLEVGRAREVQLTRALEKDGSLSGLRWSPDGRRLAFLVQDDSERPALVVPHYLPERVVAESVKEGYPNVALRVVDLEAILDVNDPQAIYRDDTFKSVDLKLGDGLHPWITVFAWSPDGRLLALDEILPDMRTRKIHVGHPGTGNVRTVYAHTDSAWHEEYDWVVTEAPVLDWAPDAGSLVFTTESTGFHHLVSVEIDTAIEHELAEAEPASKAATATPQPPISTPESRLPTPTPLTSGDWEVTWAQWLPNGRQLVVLTSREDLSQRHLELLNVEGGGLVRLATASGMNTHPQLGDQGKRVLYRHSRLGVPPDLWTIETKPSAKPRRITDRVPQRYRTEAWSIPEIVHFDARDGTPLRGFVYRPHDFDPRRRYPVVVFVHGAGSMQNVVDGWTIYSPNFKFHTVLTQRGFVVFEVDYRGSLGYGYEFRTGVHMYVGGKDLDDELAGIDYLKTFDWVDPARIGIYGGSYGGFMALMAMFRAPDVYACGAALRFVSDWENYYRGNPWYCIERLGKPEDNPAAYYRSSPIHFAENLEGPLLLLHGVRDDNVHFQDAAQLVERLIRLEKPFELMIYPVERHGFSEPESWIDEYARIEEFFIRHLQPQSGTGSRGTDGAPE